MDENRIKVGMTVNYIHYPSMKPKTGKVKALVKVINHINKKIIGKTVGFVEYQNGCIPDLVFIEDMTLIKS